MYDVAVLLLKVIADEDDQMQTIFLSSSRLCLNLPSSTRTGRI